MYMMAQQKDSMGKVLADIWNSLETGIVVFQNGQLQNANQAAQNLLQMQGEDLGPYRESLLALLEITEEAKYSKQLTGVIGKPLTAILHNQPSNQIQFVELSESYETRLGEATHELRRPLTNVKTIIDTLYLWGAGEDPNARPRFLEQLHAQVDRLVTTVNELLNLSRIQAGSIPINVQQIAFFVMVDECFEMLAEQAQQKNVQLVSKVDRDFVLLADRDKIQHVVQNLIENAIRYNKEGGSVTVQASKDKANTFVVSDTGEGISQENQEHVFERFKRVNKEIPGTGLGLSIVKAIVDLHGGRIKLDSEPGQGSSFEVALAIPHIVKAPSFS